MIRRSEQVVLAIRVVDSMIRECPALGTTETQVALKGKSLLGEILSLQCHLGTNASHTAGCPLAMHISATSPNQAFSRYSLPLKLERLKA